MSCIDTGSSSGVKDRCELFRVNFPNCVCEKESVSPLSPCPVADEEQILRLIFSPIHIDEETGEVTPAAFSDVSNKGLSVNRLTHSSFSELNAKGNEKATKDASEGKTREYLGIVHAKCGDIRETSRDGRRLFCVYDTSVANDISHADVCQAVSEGKSKDKAARRLLQKAFTKRPTILEKS